MSIDADDSREETGVLPVDISLTLGEGGELWVARDEDTGVTSQGPTREAALDNLDEAVAGYRGAGEPPSDADLREAGIDPERNESGSIDESDIFE
ncbi:type II toxin-antitoxin system HicB family antitoxin [Halococcoides cellulosivorans]|uniref:Type II toxin-antitoxin system HicB family antitoxin n=1 Tax=Halococcoides cellulosivorans TaxID=1679096 RepID=A0A2R4WZ66_9EURY|nr:type II toxin-antitoxin system HicB family antitoxin [Halococcoides cellulosivorans]AWB26830.1 type II toxin-antitoxin system HicB family antitoxin [Halococcoides cellulosivorans]